MSVHGICLLGDEPRQCDVNTGLLWMNLASIWPLWQRVVKLLGPSSCLVAPSTPKCPEGILPESIIASINSSSITRMERNWERIESDSWCCLLIPMRGNPRDDWFLWMDSRADEVGHCWQQNLSSFFRGIAGIQALWFFKVHTITPGSLNDTDLKIS